MLRSRSTAAAAALGLTLLTAATLVRAAQFNDGTATWFPSPDPLEWSNQVTVGDLDGDGDLDLIFANGGNFSTAGTNQKVRVFINEPAASRFLDKSDERTGGLAGLYRGAELGDCDLDGDLDVILAQDFNRLPELLINDGAGFFTREGATRLPAITLSSSRGQFGDVDNDGDLDLFLPNGGTTNRFGCGPYKLYLNDGTCHYTDASATHFPTGSVCQNMDAIFGDIDGDFDIDLRTGSTGTNNSRMYLNNGSGVFTIAAFPPDMNAYSYDFGDMDGDGDLDLLGANANPASNLAEYLLRNDGNVAFTNLSTQIVPNPNQDDNDSKFFDYDDDGDLDLIVARLGSGGEKLYENTNGLGSFALTTGVFQVINDSSLDIKVADVDLDGDLDVITAQGESGDFTNRIYINSGPADTHAPRIIATEQLVDPFPGGAPYVVRAAILDHMTSDRNFFDKGIVLHYTVDAGSEQQVPMRYSGGQIYRGEIPSQAGGSVVDYWVSATDFNDNTGTGAAKQVTVLGNEFAAGTTGMLVMGKGVGANLTLAWGASCSDGDNDYEIYTGTFASFTAPTKLVCTTGGLTSTTIAPSFGSRYYLIVPRDDSIEGSYGTNSDGAQRSPAAIPCRPQFIATCP